MTLISLADESWTGRRKPVYNLKLSHISGQVVVGSKSKLIYNYTHPKGNLYFIRSIKSSPPIKKRDLFKAILE